MAVFCFLVAVDLRGVFLSCSILKQDFFFLSYFLFEQDFLYFKAIPFLNKISFFRRKQAPVLLTPLVGLLVGWSVGWLVG